MQEPHAAIIGCASTVLGSREARLFAKYPPMGCIFFARNIDNPQQFRQLIDDVKTAAGWNLPIWIDQEGGRVQRLKPPHWRGFPAMEQYGKLYRENPTEGMCILPIGTMLLAKELRALGIDVDCHPVLDLRFTGAHDIVGDRAFSSDVAEVIALGSLVINSLSHAGVVPVMKHFPGHGRALCDSHEALPVVDVPFDDLLEKDLAPFIALRKTPMVMTAHIVYPAWDAGVPATFSRKILTDWWRAEMDYQGLIVSDDLAMYALKDMGTIAERAQASLKAGADMVLYCTGDEAENHALLREMPRMTPKAWQRWQTCEQIRVSMTPKISSADIHAYDTWVGGHDG